MFYSVIGTQWGDEGKGKIVDLLSKNVSIVARYQGGANAGHTVYHNDKKVVLHQIPTGALRENCICVLGNGMVIDPIGILEEISILKKMNIIIKNRILIDYYAHIVTPIHKCIDRTNEQRTDNKIGTTCKGIGPTYTDKYNRIGIRAIDLLSNNSLQEKIESRLELAIQKQQINSEDIPSLREELNIFYNACEIISEYIQDTFNYLHGDMSANMLIEGAQGTMLDIDHGTYPYVTSSNCSSGGISIGLGIPGSKLQNIIGIFKAYTTRVGGGPFPTELFDQDGKVLGDIGKEFGATTGRPRRCGWFDALVVRYAVMVNGIDRLAIVRLDTLDGLQTIRLCVGYRKNGEAIDLLPNDASDLGRCEPIYEEMPGWKQTTGHIRTWDGLPTEAKAYIERISELVNSRVFLVSVGSHRDATIFL